MEGLAKNILIGVGAVIAADATRSAVTGHIASTWGQKACIYGVGGLVVFIGHKLIGG